MDEQPVVENQFFRDRTHSTRPLPMLGAWLDKLLQEEMKQLSKEMRILSGEGQPPTTQSTSIMIKALNGINSKGQTVWWEEI